jgi:mannonate dehydratase
VGHQGEGAEGAGLSTSRRRVSRLGDGVHNFGIQEYLPHTAETDRVFPHAYTFGDGAMHPGDAPGLGVDIDEALAATHPYQRAYLPIARLMDGTMHNW